MIKKYYDNRLSNKVKSDFCKYNQVFNNGLCKHEKIPKSEIEMIKDNLLEKRTRNTNLYKDVKSNNYGSPKKYFCVKTIPREVQRLNTINPESL